VLPAAILHDPGGDTRHDPEDRFRIPVLICYLLIDTVRFFETQLTTPEPADRMRTLGTLLEGVGNDSPASFRAWIHELWVSHLATLIRLHHQRLQEVGPSAPAYWIEDMERFIERLGERAVEPGPPVPIELADSGDPEEALAEFQQLFRLYGRLLTLWPDILQAATEMVASGEMPVEHIRP
jgi:hypothetical protein